MKLFTPRISKWAWWELFKLFVLERGAYISTGPRVKKLEKEVEKLYGAKPVLTNSATSALELAYDMVGIKEGDEVITPVLTCAATNVPLLRRGADIKFADIDPDTFNADPKDVERKITKNTKAIVFTLFGGNKRGLYNATRVANDYDIPIIVDGAQLVADLYLSSRPRMTDYFVTSFGAIKTLTTGDGGALFCKDTKRAKRLAWYGIDRDKPESERDIEEPGYKFTMNDIQAAIGLGNIRGIRKELKRREEIAEIYRNSGLPIITGQWFSVFICKNEITRELARLFNQLGIHHYRNDAYSAFGGRQELPNMDNYEHRYLLLPMHHGITRRKATGLVETLRRFYS